VNYMAANLRWSESQHFKKEQLPKKPKADGPKRTIKEIENELRNKPENNAINESQLYHLLDIAIEKARQSGTLSEEEQA
jgi:hypothetical protein